MKKWNVIFWIFWCIFLITWIYLDAFVKLESVYWLVGKLIGFALLFVGQILIAILKKEESKFEVISRICFAILFISYFSYHQIAKYKSDKCDDRFGREFNARRRRLGTPEIPADWHVKYKWPGYVTWEAKDSIGHSTKDITIDSTCAIKYEDDEYNLVRIDGKSRYVYIRTHYAKGKGIDSIFYHYDLGDSSRSITRQQADSIFAAEKIKKDY